ncbi:hypothetical protein NG99_22545 [Erwinia typographi]|uniref:Uncharacterized protein n=1 Tax=Erwinia typographi TaxID=371042 RepID=A0A0A3YRJ1_9GAMM|nr:hypothetical protein NG99_22545 [Erwinia typographi]
MLYASNFYGLKKPAGALLLVLENLFYIDAFLSMRKLLRFQPVTFLPPQKIKQGSFRRGYYRFLKSAT